MATIEILLTLLPMVHAPHSRKTFPNIDSLLGTYGTNKFECIQNYSHPKINIKMIVIKNNIEKNNVQNLSIRFS